MLTAIEAKLKAYRKRDFFAIVEGKISDAADNGEMMCTIQIDDLPNGSVGMLYEITNLLYELGYRTLISHSNTLTIYWNVKLPTYYNIDDDFDNIEE
jgi:hypothetical protein